MSPWDFPFTFHGQGRGSLLSTCEACLQVSPPSHWNCPRGWEQARSVALRAISDPDPNPMSSLELTDWILSSSTHCSHSQRKAQPTSSVGGPWFWHRCWGLLPMVHPGVAWNEWVMLRPYPPELKARWMNTGRKPLLGQFHTQGCLPITQVEPQAHHRVTQQSSDSGPSPDSG